MRSYPPIGLNLLSLDYRLPALPLELDRMSPYMLNFDYLNPATCSLYDDVAFRPEASKRLNKSLSCENNFDSLRTMTNPIR